MADAITIKALQDASLDAKSLEEVVNGNEVKQVTTRKGETYPSVKKAIMTMFQNGGLPAAPFATKALMTASALVDGKYAMVTNDTVSDNNGLYVKTAGVWVKSAYDPVAQADKNTSTKIVFDESGLEVFKVVDAGGNTTLRQLSNGDIDIPKVGNLSDFVADIQERVYLESGINNEAVHLTSKYIDKFNAAKAEPFVQDFTLITTTDIRDSGLVSNHEVTSIRGGNLDRVGKSEFVIGIGALSADGDFSNRSGFTARITVDEVNKTITTSHLSLINQGYTRPDGSELFGAGSSNVYDHTTGTYHKVYALRSGTAYHELHYTYSTDKGVTWSDPVDISQMKNDLGWNVLAPIGEGIIKRYGKHKGRIVLPCWTTQAGYTDHLFRSGYLYSDDSGSSWYFGEFIDTNFSNECQVAEDVNGDLIFAIRVEMSAASGLANKIFARLSDKTKEYAIIDSGRELSEANIKTGLYNGDNVYDASPCKFLFSTCLHGDRTGLGIYTSYDGAESWGKYEVAALNTSTVAYTSIATVSPELVLVVYETGYTAIRAVLVSTNNLVYGD